MTVLAHSSHWLMSLLYVAPVLVMTVLLGYLHWKDRRAGDPDSPEPPPE